MEAPTQRTTIVLALDAEKAPLTCANFKRYADEGKLFRAYDRHRVVYTAAEIAELTGSTRVEVPSAEELPDITAQAIDGYIVGGTVYCDGIENASS